MFSRYGEWRRGKFVAGKITNVTIFVWRMCGKSGGIDIRISVMI